MARMNIGCTPWGEDCAQTIDKDYDAKARVECQVYREQLIRHYKKAHGGAEPPCKLFTSSNPHDFRTYFEVAARFEEDTPEEKAAYWFENHSPEFWDDTARRQLKEHGYVVPA